MNIMSEYVIQQVQGRPNCIQTQGVPIVFDTRVESTLNSKHVLLK